MIKLFNRIFYIGAALAIICTGVSAKSFQSPPLKIVNGTDAEESEFPYMVHFFEELNFLTCGGTIIGYKWILTAGHCITDGSNGSIIYGTNILFDQIGGNTIKVKKVHLHPKFQYNENLVPIYDVAILELEKSIQYSEKAQPINLPVGEEVPFHLFGVLTGWGVNETEADSYQNNLQKIRLRLLTDEECAAQLDEIEGPGNFDSKHHLCSDDFWNGECYGDSGGPFAINGIQYGIVSWSFKPCGSSPGTYTRITNPEIRDFIKSIAGV